MPVMDPDRWRSLGSLLDHVLDLDPGARAEWLDDLRRRAPGIAGDLERMLAEEEAADSEGFLATPYAAPATPAGTRLGAWRLERQIGEGGMGVVWLARRADGQFEGVAAVKLLALSLVGAAGEARFRREGSALARLAHPNIARLLDAGVAPAGQPYLVLEHVDGEQIDAWVTSRAPSRQEIVRLFIGVLGAVAHAHANLIVHRDLKPSNILVTADGTPKLLDFGIAKLLDEGTGDESITREGRPLTPSWAAPEQLQGGTVTTATDVWALGTLLHLLLTGGLAPAPYRMGDLDAIVAKATRDDPAERYQTVGELADDLGRWLAAKPVRARPHSLAYRARRFVARHRAATTAAVVVALLLAGAAVRERTLRARAESEGRKARAIQEYLASVFGGADPYRSPATRDTMVTARTLLDRGALRVDSVLTDQPDAQAELRRAIAGIYVNMGAYDRAVPLLRRALEQLRALHGARHLEVAAAMGELGNALAKQNAFAEADTLLRGALEMRRALLGPTDSSTATSLDHLATMLQDRNDWDGADSLFRQALAARREALGPTHPRVARSINNLALLGFVRGRYDDALPLYREALAIYDLHRREPGVEAERTQTVQNIAQVQQLRGRFEESEALYRQALADKRRIFGDLHPSVTISLNNLGAMLARDLGRPDDAEPLIREALALDLRMFGPRHSYYGQSLNNLATVLRAKGEFAAADSLYREALGVNRALFGERHSYVAQSLNNVGTTRLASGDAAGAIPDLRRSLALYGELSGTSHGSYIVVGLNLGRALREAGRASEADSIFRAIVARGDTTSVVKRGALLMARVGIVNGMIDRGLADEALPLAEEADAVARRDLRPTDARRAEAHYTLGRTLAALGQRPRATAALLAADSILAPMRRAHPRLSERLSAELRRVRAGS